VYFKEESILNLCMGVLKVKLNLYKVKLNGKYVKVKLEKGVNVLDLMRQLGVNRETHLARKNGELISELEAVCGKDKIEIFGVVYGG
jgi:sulfur carrier protein ThiS